MFRKGDLEEGDLVGNGRSYGGGCVAFVGEVQGMLVCRSAICMKAAMHSIPFRQQSTHTDTHTNAATKHNRQTVYMLQAVYAFLLRLHSPHRPDTVTNFNGNC